MDVIEVENLWKKFRIPHEKKTTILENIAGAFQILEGKRFTYEEFWALREVNFSVQLGESIGVIGDNGSGKSTLLKVIARIMRPDKGMVKTHGKIAPILEYGLGFHPDLTVKENVIVYGSIMGLKNGEIKKCMGSILEFSGIGKFRDAKLKNLSSGMQVRLGFSVAIESDPDIFLVDEALAVGDIEFRQKCMDKFKQFKAEKKSIVLVSHVLGLVKEFCTKTLFLSNGQMVRYGETEDIVDEYVKQVQARQQS
jgi:lipopolysaccharide transport system ATP-binding protein